MPEQGKFNLTVMDIDTILYKNEVTNVVVPGDKGEFELLQFHYPVLNLLKAGDIIIDWKEYITVNRGIVKFLKDDCTIIVEIAD
jgi:F0F1-type ATP synthase epsilon subunit